MTPPPDGPLDPGSRTPARLFRWLARGRLPMIGLVFGATWVVRQAAWPVLLGNAVGATTQDFGPHLILPLLALAGVVVVQSTAGILNYRFSYTNYLPT